MADLAGDLAVVRELVAGSGGLCTVAVARPDGTVHATVVNAGLTEHPVDGRPVVGLVARSAAAKVRFLRATPRAAVTFRVEWRWATVEGPVTLVGPDDALPGLDSGQVPALLRQVFKACGGTHDDWDTYDRVMAAERRLAVLVDVERVLQNRPV
jgi:PPOX class probable F420-dependent enzyme